MHRILVGLVFASAIWLVGVVAIAATPPASPLRSVLHPRAMPVDTNPCSVVVCW
jgi:hypothetical protein